MKHLFYRSTTTTFVLSALISVVGCGGGAAKDERPERVPVSGIVMYEGKPVDGAAITFRSTSGGPGASGKTDADGRFVLSTFEGGDGAVPGRYNVGITKFDLSTDSANAVPDMDDPDYNGEEEVIEDEEEDGPRRRGSGPKNLLPEQFADPDNGSLNADIKEATDSLEFTLD